jgi:hypothetical protein
LPRYIANTSGGIGMTTGTWTRALCALGTMLVATGALAHDETGSVRSWHDAQHPSCRLVKVLAREALPAAEEDDGATVEKWVIEACRGAKYTYQVTTFESGAMVSDFEEDAMADVPGTAGEARVASNAPDDYITHVTPDASELHDAAIRPFIAQARATWPDAKARYLAGLPDGQILFVTVRLFEDGADRAGSDYEQIFVRVDAFDGSTVHGRIANDLVKLRAHRNGDPIDVAEADVLDWTITRPDGSEEGNLIGKYHDTLLQAE